MDPKSEYLATVARVIPRARCVAYRAARCDLGRIEFIDQCEKCCSIYEPNINADFNLVDAKEPRVRVTCFACSTSKTFPGTVPKVLKKMRKAKSKAISVRMGREERESIVEAERERREKRKTKRDASTTTELGEKKVKTSSLMGLSSSLNR